MRITTMLSISVVGRVATATRTSADPNRCRPRERRMTISASKRSRPRGRACFAVALRACSAVRVGLLAGRSQHHRSGSFAALGSLPGYSESEASAVSADGRVVAGSSRSRAGLTQAFRWSGPEGMTALGFLPQGSSPGLGHLGGRRGDRRRCRWRQSPRLACIPLDPRSRLDAACRTAQCSCLRRERCFRRWIGRCRHLPRADERGVSLDAGNRCNRPGTLRHRQQFDQHGERGLRRRCNHRRRRSSSFDRRSYLGCFQCAHDHRRTTGRYRWRDHGAFPRRNGCSRQVSTPPVTNVLSARTSTGEVVPLATTRTFTATIATAISADGRRITGWGSRESGPDAAVLWDESGALRVVSDLLSNDGQAASAGWSLTRARGISADGRVIVGDGIDPEGTARGWDRYAE